MKQPVFVLGIPRPHQMGLAAHNTEGFVRDRQATWRMKAYCSVPPPPSHFSGVTCPSAPPGVTVLPVGDTCLEPRCWLWDGSPTAEEKSDAGSQVCLCGASHWRGHPLICPTWPSGLILNVCISPLTSSWVILLLHLYFPGWRLEGLQPTQATGFWATEPPSLSSAQFQVCPEH